MTEEEPEAAVGEASLAATAPAAAAAAAAAATVVVVQLVVAVPPWQIVRAGTRTPPTFSAQGGSLRHPRHSRSSSNSSNSANNANSGGRVVFLPPLRPPPPPPPPPPPRPRLQRPRRRRRPHGVVITAMRRCHKAEPARRLGRTLLLTAVALYKVYTDLFENFSF